MIKNCFFLVYLFSISLGSQELLSKTTRYVTTGDGVLRMYVNVWGHVNNPGRLLIDEGTDIATLFSLTGGPKKGANLKNIYIYREFPDQEGKKLYKINFKEFLKNGDRSNFISIQPNDTFIINQTISSYLIGEIGTLNTVMNFINLYLNLANLLDKES